MKLLILAVIKCYWKLIPEHKRRTCIYRVSCSKYIYSVTSEKGFLAGLHALRLRVRTCRPNYSWTIDNNTKILNLCMCDGTIIKEEMISKNLIAELKSTYQKVID